MARTAARTTRTPATSRRGSGVPKRKAPSSGTKPRRPHQATKPRSSATKTVRKAAKASPKKSRQRKPRATPAKKRTGTLKLAPSKKKSAARAKKTAASSASKAKKKVQARRIHSLAGRGRARTVLARKGSKGATSRRIPRRRRAAPRVVRCAICGNLVPWVSVDRCCFPCLKKGLAVRKREEELVWGTLDVDEELLSVLK